MIKNARTISDIFPERIFVFLHLIYEQTVLFLLLTFNNDRKEEYGFRWFSGPGCKFQRVLD